MDREFLFLRMWLVMGHDELRNSDQGAQNLSRQAIIKLNIISHLGMTRQGL